MPSAIKIDGKGVCETGHSDSMVKTVAELAGTAPPAVKGRVGPKPVREGD